MAANGWLGTGQAQLGPQTWPANLAIRRGPLEVEYTVAESIGSKPVHPSASDDGRSAIKKLMLEFDELPPDVRAALSLAHQPSDQMIDILCNMHRSGFPQTALLKVIAANNAKRDLP